jgi:hypothetical protein
MDTYYNSSDEEDYFSDDDMDEEDPSDMDGDEMDEFNHTSGNSSSIQTSNPNEVKGLAKLLYEKMLAEEDVDVDIFIGHQRKCVKGHKLVLAAGLSNVLATQLNAPLWKNEMNDGKSIEFPEEASEEAALVFIKVGQSSVVN